MGNITGINAGQKPAAKVELKKQQEQKATENASVFTDTQKTQAPAAETPKAPTTEAPKAQEAPQKAGNWFTRWLKGEDKGTFDGKNDGRISFKEKAEFFGKGLIGMVKGVINHPVATLATMAAATAITIATGGAAIPFMLWGGVILGGAQLAYGAGKLANASTDAQAQEACESMGNGFASLAMSGLGLKSYMKAKTNYIANTKSRAAKLMKSKDAAVRKEASAILREDPNNLAAHQKFNLAHPEAKAPVAAKGSLRDRLSAWFNKGKETTHAQKMANNKNDNFYKIVTEGTPEQQIYTNNHCIKGGLEEMPTKPSILKRAWIGLKELFFNTGSKSLAKRPELPKMSVNEAKANLKAARLALKQAEGYMKNANAFGGARDAQAKLQQAQAALKDARQIMTLALKEQKAAGPSLLETGIAGVRQQRATLKDTAAIKAEATDDLIQAFSNNLPKEPVRTGLDIAKVGIKGHLEQAKFGVQDMVLSGKEKGLTAAQDIITFTGKTTHTVADKVSRGATMAKNGINLGAKWVGNQVSVIPTTKTSAATVPFAIADISTKPGMLYDEAVEVSFK